MPRRATATRPSSSSRPKNFTTRWASCIVKHGTHVIVEGDIDGNGKADFQIDVHNLTDTLNNLRKGDFIL
jgi:hypothetical protein